MKHILPRFKEECFLFEVLYHQLKQRENTLKDIASTALDLLSLF